MASGELSARQLVEAYLERIEAIDRRRTDAAQRARDQSGCARDCRRARHGARRGTRSRPAARHAHPAQGQHRHRRSHADHGRVAGAARTRTSRPTRPSSPGCGTPGRSILGKTNLSEWANFRSSRSSSGWSGRGRQTRNPFVLDRSPGGSSSGSGVAVSANLCMAALGSETDGSIMSPSSNNGVVGHQADGRPDERHRGNPDLAHPGRGRPTRAHGGRRRAAVLSAIAESGVDYRAGLDRDALRARASVSPENSTPATASTPTASSTAPWTCSSAVAPS